MFPKQREVYVPLLREMIRRGGATKPSARNAEGRTVYEALADYFDLSPEARDKSYKDTYTRPYRK